MSAQKRGNGFSLHREHKQPFNKKQRSSQPMSHSASFDGRPHQPQLSATELQTGLVALLDRFVAAEATPEADRDILLHARELRRLVAARTAKSTSAQARRDLDEKRPDKTAHVTVPDYIHRKVVDAKHLPPLPPMTEPHLEQAVFTHQSVHANHLNVHQHIDLGLDYERLEYLGDAYVQLIASRSLYNRFPVVDVPQLCSWRERLVENITLAKFSQAYGFPDRLHSKFDYDKTGKGWMKVTADIFEAYVAAVVLSDPVNGFRTAENWLDELWAPQILNFKEKVTENAAARDDLLKLVAMNGVQVNYREERPMLVDRGAQRYFLGAYLTGWGYEDEWLGSGEGQKKSQACIAAANDAIKRDSPILRDAARQKKELMAIRARERELAEAANGDKGEEVANEDKGDEVRLAPESAESPESAKKKRKSEGVEPPEKKSKKHKKNKKDMTEKQEDKEK